MPLCSQAFLVTLSISEHLLYQLENGDIKTCSPISQSYCKESVRCHSKEVGVEQLYEDLQDILELTPKRDVLFIIGDWNAKVGSQETPGITGKFGLGVQNEARQRLIEFCQENTLVIANNLLQ